MNAQNLTGQTLGQYQLRELLGIGGMGAVYRANQPSLNRSVAVKVMSAALVNEGGYIERFYREAKIAAALEHTHIIPVYDYGVQGEISYLVMRLLTGGSLMDRLTQHAGGQLSLPSIGEVADLLNQLAGALDYAHSQGVIHRDIKPNNVMFDNHGSAYVVDFGIAKLVQGTSMMTGSGVLMGTPMFMPPEQWRSEEITPATDQYALAVMIYLLVTGQAPFQADTPHGLMYKHLNDMPTPPRLIRSEIPEAITPVLERALAKEPGKRFPSVSTFAQTFSGAIAGGPGEKTNFFSAPIRRTKSAPTGGGSSEVRAASGRAKGRLWIALGLILIILFVGALVKGLQEFGGSPRPTDVSATATRLVATTMVALLPSPTQKSPGTITEPGPTELSTTGLPTATPNTQQTLEALAATTVAQRQTQTAIAAASSTKTPTPDLEQTLRVVVAQTETALASTATANAIASFTKTPTPTSTSTSTATPSPTPTATATPALVSMANPPAAMVISPENASQVTEWASFKVQTYPVTVAVSPDGKELAVVAYKLSFYDLPTLQLIREIDSRYGFQHCVFAPDWTLIVTRETVQNGDEARAWDTVSGGTIRTFDALSGFDYNYTDVPLALSNDAKWLAVRLSNVIKIVEVATGRVAKTLTLDTMSPVSTLAYSPDGKLLAVGTYGGIQLWDTESWQFHTIGDNISGSMRHLVFSKDGTKLAALAGGREDTLVAWEIPGGRQLFARNTGAETSFYGSLAFSPDGRLLASGHQAAVLLWDARNGSPAGILTGHTKDIVAIAFAPNGTMLVTASQDQTVKLWGMPNP